MKILKSEFDKIREELDALSLTAYWLETYSLGLRERCKSLKAFLDNLEKTDTVKNGPIVA